MKRGCRGLGLIAESALRHQCCHHNHYSTASPAPKQRDDVTTSSSVSPASSRPPRLDPIQPSSEPQWHSRASFTSHLPTAPQIASRVKTVLRRFPQPVVVVTAAAPRSWTGPRDPVGMTVSSFTSLDLEGDVAAVCFNVRRPSRTLDAILGGNGVFNVHVLAGDTTGARIAHHFTRPNSAPNDTDPIGSSAAEIPGSESEITPPHGLFDHIQEKLGCTLAAADLDIQDDSGGSTSPLPPMLRGPGVLYVLTCRVPRSSPQDGISLPQVMSHTIVVAGVMEVSVGDGRQAAPTSSRPGDDRATAQKLGLLYGDRQYRGPGVAFMNGDGSIPSKD